MDFIRAKKFDYVCGHRVDAINGLGNIRMISREATFVLYPSYVLFDK